MKYLTLSAFYDSYLRDDDDKFLYSDSFLRDDYDDMFTHEHLDIPSPLLDEIITWYKEYLPIIPMSESERSVHWELIEKLDTQGVDIVNRLNSIFAGSIKCRYYSEGKLMHIYR